MSFILLLECLTRPLTQAVLTSSPSALNDWPGPLLRAVLHFFP